MGVGQWGSGSGGHGQWGSDLVSSFYKRETRSDPNGADPNGSPNLKLGLTRMAPREWRPKLDTRSDPNGARMAPVKLGLTRMAPEWRPEWRPRKGGRNRKPESVPVPLLFNPECPRNQISSLTPKARHVSPDGSLRPDGTKLLGSGKPTTAKSS